MSIVEDESFGIIPLRQQKNIWEVFLILHKAGNHWGFPKGHKDSNETALQAAMRELTEETGLQVERCLLEEPLTEQYHFKTKTHLISKKVFYFPAIVTGTIALQEEEIREGKWVELDKALAILTFKEGRSICRQIMELVKLQ